jgi:hypothetical protein
MKDILFEKSAVKIVLDELKKKGYKWTNVSYINLGRYALVQGKPNIFIALKKEFFMKYGEFAKKYNWRNEDGLLEKGIGQTINKEHLKLMIQNNVETIYFIMSSGEIYNISLHDFLSKSHDWINKEHREVRSCSIHLLQRVNS